MPIGGDDDTLAHPSLPHARAGGIDESELAAGRYRMVRWLGAGGMGRVYEALDTELDERVALKASRSGRSASTAARARSSPPPSSSAAASPPHCRRARRRSARRGS